MLGILFLLLYCLLPCFYSNLCVLSGLDGLVVWICVWLFVNYVALTGGVFGFVGVGLLLLVIFFVLRFCKFACYLVVEFVLVMVKCCCFGV